LAVGGEPRASPRERAPRRALARVAQRLARFVGGGGATGSACVWRLRMRRWTEVGTLLCNTALSVGRRR